VCQDWGGLGHHSPYPVPCEIHSSVQLGPAALVPTTHNLNYGLSLPLQLNILEIHTGSPHSFSLPNKPTWVLEQRQSKKWVCFFPREEQPTLPFPETVQCVL